MLEVKSDDGVMTIVGGNRRAVPPRAQNVCGSDGCWSSFPESEEES